MTSVSGKRGITVPQILFHEGEGLTVTIECIDGALYRGRASNTEDNFNVHLLDAVVTARDGSERTLDRVFIRGSAIVFIIFPDVLQRAPVFDRVRAVAAGRTVATGLGKLRAQCG